MHVPTISSWVNYICTTYFSSLAAGRKKDLRVFFFCFVLFPGREDHFSVSRALAAVVLYANQLSILETASLYARA